MRITQQECGAGCSCFTCGVQAELVKMVGWVGGTSEKRKVARRVGFPLERV